MTREEAKSELMQIYMSLSEEKKQALDVLMAQADGEYKSNKELLCDSCYRKIAGCQAKFHNPHPVDHCIEYKPIEKQADGDLISRQAVLDYIYNDLGLGDEENGKDVERQMELDSSYRYVKSLPPVTPQPKTGHWCRKTKVDAYDIAGVKTWGIKCQCDRCDFTTIVVEDFGYYKYCPNCGAKMVEPQESEE